MSNTTENLTALADVLKTYWGYDRFLPLQPEAMACVMEDRDSLVVLPTGGGKSLCFQAPAVCRGGLGVVVSPLIALMKDQVDSLRESGIAAEAIHSGMSADRKQEIAAAIRRGKYRLIYMAPETLVRPQMLDLLSNQPVSFFAIDEAHCISAWGHDFRPEYRELANLRQRFPQVPIHAYTATATPEVQTEIVTILGLRDPEILVGDFFRPNLVYHVAKKDKTINQIVSVIERHSDQSGLIYCISRAETESLSEALAKLGYSCTAYHAGLGDTERTRRQEDFINDETRIIVATIAFGMGIDKPDGRFVIHSGMPKSLANYQQETGRAGRDGLEAECWLLYSGQDLLLWRRILENSPPESRAAGDALLKGIHGFCVSTQCRHRGLVEHFGQAWSRGKCDACDVCRGQFEEVADPLVLGQKILSCVIRAKENFGAAHIANILVGSANKDIMSRHHHELSTYGLLREFRITDIRDWIEQLVAQGFLQRVGEFNVIKVTSKGWEVLRGGKTPRLSRATKREAASTRASIVDSWEGVDQPLFDRLRDWRRKIAVERGVPPYIIFGDVSLRDLARRRPTSLDNLRDVHGIGSKKLDDFGPQLVALISQHCNEHSVSTDQGPLKSPRVDSKNPAAMAAFELFAQGVSIIDVAQRLTRAESTVRQYLEAYIQTHRIKDPSPWLNTDEFAAIRAVAQHAGLERLKPIFEALHGKISYNQIGIAVAVLRNQEFRAIAD